MPDNLQTLREIDKIDRIGLEGVHENLTKCGWTPEQAECIIYFIKLVRKGETNEERLALAQMWFNIMNASDEQLTKLIDLLP